MKSLFYNEGGLQCGRKFLLPLRFSLKPGILVPVVWILCVFIINERWNNKTFFFFSSYDLLPKTEAAVKTRERFFFLPPLRGEKKFHRGPQFGGNLKTVYSTSLARLSFHVILCG